MGKPMSLIDIRRKNLSLISILDKKEKIYRVERKQQNEEVRMMVQRRDPVGTYLILKQVLKKVIEMIILNRMKKY